MSRESCIAHPPKQAIAIVRQDYYELMNRDACAAALLNIFEYWANAAIAADPSVERPWVGARPIREFEQMLLGIATDKQIRQRLAQLEARGFIAMRVPAKRGAAKAYRVLVPEIQQAISSQMTEAERTLGSNNRKGVGQITAGLRLLGSNDRLGMGQITAAASVKPPPLLRSNDRALKKKSQEFKKEDLKEKNSDLLLPLPEPEKPIAESSDLKPIIAKAAIQVGAVRYAQPPESIDLAEFWATHPEQARAQIKAIAPGHKRPELVAHSVGQWWIGPGLNDFDAHLIQACRNRKRKFQQPDSDSDAKTFINNIIRNDDWANFALRCDEAKALRQRTALREQAPTALRQSKSPFERSAQDRRESALGLARFKVARGDIERAIAISEQFNLSRAEIGLCKKVVNQHPLLQAA